MSRFGDLLGGKKAAPAPTPAPEPVVEPVVVKEPVLEKMDKKELEEYGRTLGVELDRRHSKKKLIEELEGLGD